MGSLQERITRAFGEAVGEHADIAELRSFLRASHSDAALSGMLSTVPASKLRELLPTHRDRARFLATHPPLDAGALFRRLPDLTAER